MHPYSPHHHTHTIQRLLRYLGAEERAALAQKTAAMQQEGVEVRERSMGVSACLSV